MRELFFQRIPYPPRRVDAMNGNINSTDPYADVRPDLLRDAGYVYSHNALLTLLTPSTEAPPSLPREALRANQSKSEPTPVFTRGRHRRETTADSRPSFLTIVRNILARRGRHAR
jgi:hypothetical protein